MRQGDQAIDATVGNGHDTLFLAEKVGPSGRVFGFDIQAEAIGATQARLDASSLADRVILFQACHSTLSDCFEGEIRAAMFNLGYLPGGDKTLVTRTATTLTAVAAALSRLMPGGLMTVMVYPGHPGGDDEAEQVESWAAGLDSENFAVEIHRWKGRTATPPRLIAIERRAPV